MCNQLTQHFTKETVNPSHPGTNWIPVDERGDLRLDLDHWCEACNTVGMTENEYAYCWKCGYEDWVHSPGKIEGRYGIKPFKGRQIDFFKPVRVYRNLHSGKWSVKQFGVVVAHCDALTLLDATYVVSEAGRQRVTREGRKNVHAYVSGYIYLGVDTNYSETYGELTPVTYNPYKNEGFTIGDGFTAHSTNLAVLSSNGKLTADY